MTGGERDSKIYLSQDEALSVACGLRKAEIWYAAENMPKQEKEARRLAAEFTALWEDRRRKTHENKKRSLGKKALR